MKGRYKQLQFRWRGFFRACRMEDNRTFPDVDHVCIQRMECLNLSWCRNKEPIKNTTPVAHLWNRDSDFPLPKYQYIVRVWDKTTGDERCNFCWRACYGKPVRTICRYVVFSFDSVCPLFVTECIYYYRTKSLLLHGERRAVLQIGSPDPSKIPGSFQFHYPAMYDCRYPCTIRNI